MLLQIIPDINIENKKVLGLMENIHFYKSLAKRFRSTKEYFIINDPHKITYEILMTDNDLKFFIGFDDELKDNIETELNVCWKQATFKKIDVPTFTLGKVKELELEEHWFLSLKTDYRAEYPLSNILETQTILKKNECISIKLELTPMATTWYREVEEHLKKFDQGKVTSKTSFSFKEIGFAGLEMALDCVYTGLDFINDLVSDEKIEHERISNNRHSKLLRNGLSTDTKEKSRYNAYKTKIFITINSDRSDMLFRNIERAFNSMAGDNKWLLVDKSKYKNVLSSRELAQILQMPTKHYQNTYHIEAIGRKELDVDPALLNGNIPMGSVTFKGETKNIFWYDHDLDKFMLPKVWQGFSRSGKTTALKNFNIDTANAGFWNLVIDVNEGDLVDDAIKYMNDKIPDDKIVVLDFSNPNAIYRLGLTEFLTNTGDQDIERLSGKVSDIMGYLLDAINNEPLSDRMKRYFNSAVRLCLANGYAGIEDFRSILENHIFRCKLIEQSKEKVRDKVIYDMESLNKTDTKGNVVDTRFDMISGILDRLSILTQTDILEDALMGTPNKEIDFYKWFNDGYFVGVKVPKGDLGLETVNTIVTFIVQKAWSAILMRYNLPKHKRAPGFITLDEPHSFPFVCRILTGAIRESAKYRAGFNFAVHDLKDLDVLLPKLKAAGSNFMIFQTDIANWKQVESLIKPITTDEALEIKQYHAVHSLVYGDGRIVQDVSVLLEPKKRFKEINRKLIDLYCEEI